MFFCAYACRHIYCYNRHNTASFRPSPIQSQVQMGNLNFSLGRVQYDTLSQSTFPLEAKIGVGVGASIVALIVFIIVLIYRWERLQELE